MSENVTAIFETHRDAGVAIDRLVENGFPQDDISLLVSESHHGEHFAVVAKSKAPEGVAAGATLGGTLGAIAAGVAAVGTLAIPGVGVLATGPLVAAAAGLAAGGGAGGLVGGLIGLGIPEHEAKLFEEEVKKGGILVGVKAEKGREDLAKGILQDSDAQKVAAH